MTTQAVIAWAQTQIKETAAAKIQYAPEYASDTSLTVPSSIALADNIRFRKMGGVPLTFFDLHIDILIPRNILEDTLYWFNGVPKAVADVFRDDPTLGGNAMTYDGDVVAKLASQKTAATATEPGIDVIGYTFTVPNIKLNE